MLHKNVKLLLFFHEPGTCGDAVIKILGNSTFNGKKIVATHIATLDRLEKRTAFMKSVGLAEMDPIKSSFCGKSKLKYHAGAVAAWKDAGYKVAACAQ